MLAVVASALGGCSAAGTPSDDEPPSIRRLVWSATSWPQPPATGALAGLLLVGAGPPAPVELGPLVRAINLANPRLDQVASVELATAAWSAARARGIDPAFFGATILQESGFDPRAISRAGAVGIAQFTLDTAASYGVDPFAWRSSIRGSARLLASYVRAYRGRYDDPYATALAAYNAGPGAVAAYGGIPPYPETREYVADIYGRWSRLVRREGPGARRRTQPDAARAH